MIELNEDQKKAYERYIRLYKKIKRENIPQSDVICTVDVEGLNHPMFEQNDVWLEYKEASLAWWAIEPDFRKVERMRMSRGDYGTQDSWEERSAYITDSYSKFREE